MRLGDMVHEDADHDLTVIVGNGEHVAGDRVSLALVDQHEYLAGPLFGRDDSAIARPIRFGHVFAVLVTDHGEPLLRLAVARRHTTLLRLRLDILLTGFAVPARRIREDAKSLALRQPLRP